MAEEEAQSVAGPEPCSACRGGGVVISNLGGSASELPCPWCDGGGVVLAEHDAQARWREQAAQAAQAAPGAPAGAGAD